MFWRVINRVIELMKESREIPKWARDEHMEMIVPQAELWTYSTILTSPNALLLREKQRCPAGREHCCSAALYL